MNVFLISLIFLLSLGQLQRIQLTSNVAFYLHDLLIVGFLLKEFFAVILQRKKIIENLKKFQIFQKKSFWLLTSVIVVSWFLALLEGEFDFRAILYLLRSLAYIFFVFILSNKLKNKSWLWRVVSFNILVLGFLQYFFLPDLRFLIYEGYDDHFYRLTSTILDPAFTGLIFVFNLNYYLWQKKKNWPLIVLFAAGLLLTYSRSSYLGFLLSSLVLFFSNNQNKSVKKSIVLVLVIFFMSLPFLPKQSGGAGVDLQRTVSVAARVSNDLSILQDMKGTDWLVGNGLFIPNRNRQTAENIPSHSHFADNLLVFMISNLGILGTLTTAFLLFGALREGRKVQLALMTSWLTHAMFNNSMTQSFVVLIFLGLYLNKDKLDSNN